VQVPAVMENAGGMAGKESCRRRKSGVRGRGHGDNGPQPWTDKIGELAGSGGEVGGGTSKGWGGGVRGLFFKAVTINKRRKPPDAGKIEQGQGFMSGVRPIYREGECDGYWGPPNVQGGE